MGRQVHVADPDGKEMFLQLLSALKDDVAEKASTSSRTSLGQDRGGSSWLQELVEFFQIFVRTSCNICLRIVSGSLYDTQMEGTIFEINWH